MAGSHSVIGAQPMQWLAWSVGPRLDTGGSSLDARPGCNHLPAGMRQQPVGHSHLLLEPQSPAVGPWSPPWISLPSEQETTQVSIHSASGELRTTLAAQG